MFQHPPEPAEANAAIRQTPFVDHLQIGILAGAAILVPLAFHPRSTEPFLFYKAWLLGGLGLAAATLGLSTRWLDRATWNGWPEGRLILLLLLWAGLSSLWAGNTYFTWLELPLLAAPASLCIAARTVLTTPRRRRALFTCAAVAGVIVACAAVVEVLGYPIIFREHGKILALFGYQNLFAQHLMITVGFTIGIMLLSGSRFVRGLLTLAVAVQLVALVMTMCRSAWLGLLIGWLVVVILILRAGLPGRASIRRMWPLAVTGMAAVVLTFVAVAIWGASSTSYGPELLQLRLWGLVSRGTSGRLPIWSATWDMIKESPIHGMGFGNFALEYPRFVADNIEFVRYAHNDYLQWTAELGVVGLVLLLALLAAALKRSGRLMVSRDHATRVVEMVAMAVLVGVVVDAIFSYGFYQPVPLMYLFMTIGMVRALEDEPARPSSRAALHPAGLFFAVALAALGAKFLCKNWASKDAHDTAIVARAKGDFDAALDMLERWQTLALDDPRPFYFDGVLSYEARRWDRSEKALTKAAHMSPHIWQIHHYLAMVLYRNDDLDAAERHIEKAMALCKSVREVHITAELIRQRRAELFPQRKH
ncbi:MAG: O-antigen ligase family protein [Planctomycetia bacterium]|nr:MAG: O-antigen ligase family protein [Planctomycetia bacterium]